MFEKSIRKENFYAIAINIYTDIYKSKTNMDFKMKHDCCGKRCCIMNDFNISTWTLCVKKENEYNANYFYLCNKINCKIS